jgi:hypothetical protein
MSRHCERSSFSTSTCVEIKITIIMPLHVIAFSCHMGLMHQEYFDSVDID